MLVVGGCILNRIGVHLLDGPPRENDTQCYEQRNADQLHTKQHVLERAHARVTRCDVCQSPITNKRSDSLKNTHMHTLTQTCKHVWGTSSRTQNKPIPLMVLALVPRYTIRHWSGRPPSSVAIANCHSGSTETYVCRHTIDEDKQKAQATASKRYTFPGALSTHTYKQAMGIATKITQLAHHASQ